MNMLTTPAIGAPNSFLRRVQVDPTIAAELWREIRKVVDVCCRSGVSADEVSESIECLVAFESYFRKLHNLETE